MRAYGTHQEADLQIAIYTVQSEKSGTNLLSIEFTRYDLVICMRWCKVQVKGDQKPAQKW